MVSTSLKGENINLWRIFKLIKSKIMRHYSTNLLTYADPHLGDDDTVDEQEAVAENGYGILRPDADYRSEVQPTIQQED